MSPKPRAYLTLCLAWSALVCCGKAEPTPGAGADVGVQQARPSPTEGLPTELLPEGAVALVVVPSTAALGAAAEEVGALFAEEGKAAPFPTDPVQILGMIGVPGDLSRLDRERPLAVALILANGVPTPSYLLPVDDAQAFKAGANGVPVHAAQGYVLIGATPGPGASPLATGLRPGLISLRLDLEAIGPLVAPLIQGGLGAADPGETPGVDMSALLDLVGEFVTDFFASTRTLDVALDWTSGELHLDGNLALVPDSPFTAWIGDRPTGVRDLAGALDTDTGMLFVGGFEPKVVKELLMPWIHRMVEVYPAPLRDGIRGSMQEMEKYYDYMGRAFAGSQDFGPDGLRYSYLMTPEEPRAFVDAMVELFRSPALALMGYQTGDPTEVERDGVRIVSFPLDFDMSTLVEAMGETMGETMDEAEREALDRAMGGVFGDDLTLTLAARGRYVAMQFGAETDITRILDRALAGGAPPAALAPLLAAHGDANPVLLAHIDLARVLGGAFSSMGPILGEDPPEIPAGIEVGLTLYAAGTGNDARFGFRFDLAGMVELVRAMER